MKIKYRFVTGEVVYVEADDALGAELEALEKKQENRNRAETRRHDSLEGMLEKAHQFAGDTDVQQDVEKAIIAETVRAAVEMLTKKQQRLVFLLYSKDIPSLK